MAGAFFWVFASPPAAVNSVITSSGEAVAREEYLFSAGGCIGCHKGEKRPESPSGGLELSTDFGVFYAPNITPIRSAAPVTGLAVTLLMRSSTGGHRMAVTISPLSPIAPIWD